MKRTVLDGDSVPGPLGFIALAPALSLCRRPCRPHVSAPEAALWSHPCGAVPSVQARPVYGVSEELESFLSCRTTFRHGITTLVPPFLVGRF